MSFSLAIKHGDLSLNGNSFETVSEEKKLLQDLRCALLTPTKFYENYPQYGSNLETIIGEDNWKKAAAIARAEIQRVCAEYQSRQIARNQSDAAKYGRMTIGINETLLKIRDIEMIQVENKLIIKIKLEVGKGEIELNLPVGS